MCRVISIQSDPPRSDGLVLRARPYLSIKLRVEVGWFVYDVVACTHCTGICIYHM